LATTASYTAGEADVGHTLRVAVVASNAAGSSAPASSPQTAVVTAALQAPSNVNPPSDAHTSEQQQPHDPTTGPWTGSPTAFSYEWLRSTPAPAASLFRSLATTASYTAGEADVGHTLRVAVVASNAAGSSAPASSPQTAVVTAALQAPSNVNP